MLIQGDRNELSLPFRFTYLRQRRRNRFEHDRLSDFMPQVKSGVARASSDVVIVTGDTVCSAQIRLLSELLRKLIPGDAPIVVAPGNHEFRGRTFEETLAELKEQTMPIKTSFTWT